MRPPLFRTALILFLGLQASLFGLEFPQSLRDQLRNELQKQVESGAIEGAAHLVVIRGRPEYFEVAGFSDTVDRKLLRPGSIMRIYSMSKPITSVAAMTLHEQGKFQLNDPVAKYIPAFEKAMVLEGTRGESKLMSPKRALTIRDVFRHTTGYSYGDEPEVKEYYEREKLRYVGPAEMFPPKMTIEKAAEALARIPALHHPGERFTYGFSTDLLGRLVEVWSGKPLDQYLKQAVFVPLEMVDTGFCIPQDKRDRFASCHSTKDGKLFVIDKAEKSPFNEGFEFLSGGGGLVSTMQDYANFCQMLVDGGTYNGRRVLKEETVSLMMTDQLHGVAGPFRFGLGFAIETVKLGTDKPQRETLQYSWGGYASTDFRIVPSEKLFQVVMRQHIPSSHDFNHQQIARVYSGQMIRTEEMQGQRPGFQLPDEVTFRTAEIISEGTRMAAEVFAPKNPNTEKLPTIVMSHGWGGTAESLRPDGIAFAKSGYLVVTFDYRGWGKSDSRLILSENKLERKDGKLIAEVREVREVVDPIDQTTDILNAINWVVGEYQCDPVRIGLWGSSYSGGHVVYVAARDPRVKAFISQVGSMDSRWAIANPQMRQYTFGQGTARTHGKLGYPKPREKFGTLTGAPVIEKLATYAPIEDIGRCKDCAKLFIIAENEELFDNKDHAILAYERATGVKKLVNVKGIKHYGIYNEARHQAQKEAISWFEAHLKR